MPLFEVAILKVWEEDEETKELLISPPTPVLAGSADKARISTILKSRDLIKEEDVPDLVVLVRPFV